MKKIPLDINARNFIDSYRSIGYSIETAIADIIDNSIAADATEIRVNMIWDDYQEQEPIVQIIDNGHGMSDSELIESMRLACRSPLQERSPDDLGRFGLGLKSASFSQCRTLSVVSRKLDGEPCCKIWDIDLIKDKNAFILLDSSIEESGLSDVVPDVQGTAVVWTDLDQLNIPEEAEEKMKDVYWRRIMTRVRNHIAITFGSFKNRIRFYFNDNIIELWDPFLINHSGTKVVTDESIVLKGRSVQIKSYILPSKLDGKELEEASLGKSLNELQGFYLYRNNRLIKYGGWFDLPNLNNREAYRLARVRIDIDNTMDAEWHIDIKKENAICPPSIVDKFQTYAKVARKESSRIFRSKGKTTRRASVNYKSTFLWTFGMKDMKPYYAINRDNPIVKNLSASLDSAQSKMFDFLLKSIENYIPVQSLIEAAASSNGDFVNNSASEIKDNEIALLFLELIDSLMETDNYDFNTAASFLRETEPFVNHLEIVDEVIRKEAGDE